VGARAGRQAAEGGKLTRLVQFEGRSIAVPDDATDAEVSEILSAAPAPAAPALPALAAEADRAVAQQPEVMDARAKADVAALSAAANPPQPSWLDTLKSAVMNSGATLSAVGDQAAYVPAGIRRGLTKIVGLPVDAVNAGLSLAGLPVAEKPVGGSASLDELLRLGGIIPDVRPPSTATERMLTRGAEEIGAAALPVGAAVRAGRMGVQAARELPTLARMFVEPAAINPGAFAGKEMATAAAAGGGAAVAGELARAGGAKEHGAVANTLDILGALGGAASLGAARMVGGPVKDVATAVFRPDKFSNQTVTDTVVDRLANNADMLPKVDGQPIDTQALVDAITGGRRVETVIPGFKDSVADRTGDPGLAALEYGRQSGPNAGRFTERRTENTAAVDQAMNRNAPDGNPADLRAELELERNRRLSDATVQATNAQDEAARAAAGLTPTTTPGERGNTVRTALEDARQTARDRTEAAYANADIAREPIDGGELAAAVDGATANLTQTERSLLPEGLLARVQRLAPVEEAPTPTGVLGPDGQPIMRAPPAPEPVDMKEATDLLSELSRRERAALADPRAENGGRNAARVMSQVGDAVERFVGQNLTPEQQQALAAARQAKFAEAEAFGRPGDPVADALAVREGGRPRLRDDQVAGRFVNPEAMDRLFAQADTPQTRAAIRDEVLSRGDTSSAQRIRDFVGAHGEQIDRFPGLRQELDAATAAREAEAAAQGRQQQTVRDYGQPGDERGVSTVGKYLQYGDERAQDAIKGVLASKNPSQAADELLGFVNNDPAAVAGARKSFWDLMQAKSRSNGETTRTLDGTQPWMPNRLKNFLDNPANAAVAERLYRDNPEHLQNVRRIADELQNVDLRSRAKATNTSGTAQSISQVLTPETLQSRFYAYKRGQTSLGFMLTALGSVVARRAVRGAQNDAVERLLDRALLEPELAANLLREGNPANRAALARTAKAYLGNEASTLTEILTAKPEDDPVKSAITRKNGDGR